MASFREQIESGQAGNLLHSRVQVSAVLLARKPRRFLGDPLSCDRLHVRTHHVGHTTDFGGSPDFIVGGLFLLSAIAKGFDGDIQPDFVSVLEAIGNRFGWRIGRNLYALDFYESQCHTRGPDQSGERSLAAGSQFLAGVLFLRLPSKLQTETGWSVHEFVVRWAGRQCLLERACKLQRSFDVRLASSSEVRRALGLVVPERLRCGVYLDTRARCSAHQDPWAARIASS